MLAKAVKNLHVSSGSNHTIQKQEAKPDANPEKNKEQR